MKLKSNSPIHKVATTKDLLVVDVSANLQEVWALMKLNAVRHLPVLVDDEVVGVLSTRDVTRALTMKSRFKEWSQIQPEDLDARILAGNVMSSPVSSLNADTPVLEAARLMIEQKLSAFLLTHPDGRVAGIVTSEDLLKALCDTLLESEETSLSDKGRKLLQQFPVRQIIDELSGSGI